MTTAAYAPTNEQRDIINHSGDAFIRACPGAGKTRTMVERARVVLTDRTDGRALAFLSFTNAAVDELGERLTASGAMPVPTFPNFIGTFDRFLWQFLIAPFGIDGCANAPRLIPDKKHWVVKPPFDKAQALTLECFDRQTGSLIQAKAHRVGFRPANGPGAWERVARDVISRSLADGRLDFEDVRLCVGRRLADKVFATRVGAALAGRFREVVVDEAQDCNPADLEIIAWLRGSGITVKIICDPNQGIYGFRGGVTDELESFAGTFDKTNHMPMSGNFRSSPAICAAISQLRPLASRAAPDQALGRYKAETTPVYLLSYRGVSVPSTIGATFLDLANGIGIAPHDAPLLAATWRSASNAAGRRAVDAGSDKTLGLAQSVMEFLSAFKAGNRREALGRLHCAVLIVRGHIAHAGEYGTHLTKPEVDGADWRPDVIAIGRALRPRAGESADAWLARARGLLDRDLIGPSTISQRLRRNDDLSALLDSAQATDLPARNIHSVKGLQFPAVCVVLTSQTAGRILEVLTGDSSTPELIEDARIIYVAASRAERLLAIATPRNRVAMLKALLDAGGQPVSVVEI